MLMGILLTFFRCLWNWGGDIRCAGRNRSRGPKGQKRLLGKWTRGF